jgi:hypothetical protein
MLIEAKKLSEANAPILLKEVREIVAIFSSAHKKARISAKRYKKI